ncbi:MAG: hypothetical protein FWG16_05990, partial [Micrococcales bacterium]|nr:hypothetical protein [Micrococcales bacterium]
MNKQVFRDMAEQMKPSAELMERLHRRLAETRRDTATNQVHPASPVPETSPAQESSPVSVTAPSDLAVTPSSNVSPHKWRKRPASWALAACLALLLGVG